MIMQVLRLCGQIHSVGPWTAVREAVCEAVKNSVLVVRSAGLFEVCRAGGAGYAVPRAGTDSPHPKHTR